MTMDAPQIDHAEYQKRLKSKDSESLLFIIKDAYAACEANPDNPKCGYYQDEINYSAMELRNRKLDADSKHRKDPNIINEAELHKAQVMLRLASKTYKVTELHSNHKIIVPCAVNREDAIEKAREIYRDMTRGQTSGVWECEEVTEPFVVDKPKGFTL